MASIRNATLLYRPSLSVWTARKKDKAASAKVNADAGAVNGAANVHKQLLPDSRELDAVAKWATSFRSFCYASTLPWDDSGWRIGGVARHLDFMSECTDRIRVGNDLVEELAKAYAQEIEKAKFTLNNMFNPMDYPTLAEVRSKFNFSVEVQVMPQSEDLRVVEGIPPEEVERLVSEAHATSEARIGDAMSEAYDRLYGVVTKMADTLEAFGKKDIKKFNDSLLGNVADMVAVMPALNLTNDPDLAQLTSDARQLSQYDLADLRKSPGVRDAAIADARALARRFRGHVCDDERAVIVVGAPQVDDDAVALFSDMLGLMV